MPRSLRRRRRTTTAGVARAYAGGARRVANVEPRNRRPCAFADPVLVSDVAPNRGRVARRRRPSSRCYAEARRARRRRSERRDARRARCAPDADRVARVSRDTDLDWQVIGRDQPFFGVLANERFLSENLTPTAVDEFYASGETDIAHVVDVFGSLAQDQFTPDTALDFGCGVGRLSLPMASHARRVIGVDISQGMLRIARQQAQARRVTGVEFLPTAPDETVDWVNSFIVFQHIPPERGYDMLCQLVGALRPCGFISLQLTFFRDQGHTAEIVRDLADYRYDGKTIELLSHKKDAAPGSMSMYDYDMNQVLRILFLGGIKSLVAEHTNHGGCHGAWLFGHKRG
jgi:SAM-dependent methyltransferase